MDFLDNQIFMENIHVSDRFIEKYNITECGRNSLRLHAAKFVGSLKRLM